MFFFFFFNDPATTEIYTLPLHDALPISSVPAPPGVTAKPAPAAPPVAKPVASAAAPAAGLATGGADRKSTRLNSSHLVISYAVFCLKKKKNEQALIT